MNNKGFGLIWLLLFIIFACLVIITFFIFVGKVLGIFRFNNTQPNYKNEYTVYMKEHNIILDK